MVGIDEAQVDEALNYRRLLSEVGTSPRGTGLYERDVTPAFGVDPALNVSMGEMELEINATTLSSQEFDLPPTPPRWPDPTRLASVEVEASEEGSREFTSALQADEAEGALSNEEKQRRRKVCLSP
jgi:hypothetical protein